MIKRSGTNMRKVVITPRPVWAGVVDDMRRIHERKLALELLSVASGVGERSNR